jgi:hypothetical protein
MCGGKEGSTITITYDSSSAAYNNSFGYYIKNAQGQPTTGVIIWSGVQTTVTNPTFTLTDVNPADIGFFIIPNGENSNNAAPITDGEKVDFKEVNGVWEAVSASNSSDVIQGTGANVYFDNSSLNADKFDHVETSTSNNVTTLSWEDLYDGGDKDFNDVVVSVSVSKSICDNKPSNCGRDHDHDKHPVKCDHHQGNDCHAQPPVCGNVLKDCDSHHGCSKIESFKYMNEHGQLVDGKCGEKVVTCSGSHFTMHSDGSYTHVQHDACKSFCDEIQYKTNHCVPEKACGSFSIHTSDVAPACPTHQPSHDCSDYLVDFSESKHCPPISMKEVGLSHIALKCLPTGDHCPKGGSEILEHALGSSCKTGNDSCHSSAHAPLVGIEHSPCVPPQGAMHCVDQHMQMTHHEIHVMK